MKNRVIFGDNLETLKQLPSESVNLIYIDPPFNTGKKQARKRLKTVRDEEGDRVGFKGQTYRTTVLGESSYHDAFDDYLGFLEPRLREAHRVLAAEQRPQQLQGEEAAARVDHQRAREVAVAGDHWFDRDGGAGGAPGERLVQRLRLDLDAHREATLAPAGPAIGLLGNG